MHITLYSFAVLSLLRLAQAASTNVTTTGCPSCDATSCNYRSVWSLLASCGLTLLICVWHAIHPAIPLPHWKPIDNILYQIFLVLFAFFLPELVIVFACEEWCKATKLKELAHGPDRGQTWWTMTHSYFALMGGFVLCESFTAIREIDGGDYLLLLSEKKLANSIITEDDIKDKSASDGLGKAILLAQLSWFITQVIARLVGHLTVTLVELDTVCMAVLTVPLILFWWNKPHSPRRPYVFYARKFLDDLYSQNMTQGVDGLERLLDHSTIRTERTWFKLFIADGTHFRSFVALMLSWTIFGVLHTTAWYYGFPTDVERMMWRVSSLCLTGVPVLFGIMAAVTTYDLFNVSESFKQLLESFQVFLVLAGIIFRLLLVSLMLASLRSLSYSAHQTVSWTSYIPHL